VKVKLLIDWTGYDRREPAVRQHKAGEVVEVYHIVGVKLLNRRQGKWIAQDAGDPEWTPCEPFQDKSFSHPQHHKQITGGHNR
jgi:hypothetical protein